MRKLKQFIYSILIILLIISVFPNGSKASSQKQAITLINLEVYSSTSDSSKVKGRIKEDSKISVIGKKGSWSEIRYKKKKAYVQTEYLLFAKIPTNPSAKVIKEIGKPPEKNKPYKFKDGFRLLSVDLSKLKRVKFYGTFKDPLLNWQVNKIKTAIGASKNNPYSINFIPGDSLDNYSFLNAVTEDSMDEENDPNGFKGIRIYYVSSDYLMALQAEYIIKFMLKPYLPTGYKKLAEEYITGERYHIAKSDKQWRKIDGKKVRIIFSQGAGEIHIAQKYKSKKTIFNRN